MGGVLAGFCYQLRMDSALWGSPKPTSLHNVSLGTPGEPQLVQIWPLNPSLCEAMGE